MPDAPPLPWTPPTASPPAGADRLLAVAAYLGCLIGLWLIAPIAIYALRRTRSRFAAHHAVRALLVQLAAITVSVVGSLVVLFTSLALVLIDPQALLFGLLLYGALMAGLLVYLVIVVIAAVQALHGQVVRDSRLGRATEWLLAQDVGVPADDG
jgi:uncharacterized Tic20 family protein